jgi:chromosome segregation ATPase
VVDYRHYLEDSDLDGKGTSWMGVTEFLEEETDREIQELENAIEEKSRDIELRKSSFSDSVSEIQDELLDLGRELNNTVMEGYMSQLDRKRRADLESRIKDLRRERRQRRRERDDRVETLRDEKRELERELRDLLRSRYLDDLL